jgi:photosystem II stability/assembly factor-like uncharacterized protein
MLANDRSLLSSLALSYPRTLGGVAALLLLAGCDIAPGPVVEQVVPDEPPWEEVTLGTDAEFFDMVFVDADHGWIVGGGPFVEGGLVGRTSDGGATWRYDSGLVRERGVSRFRITGIEILPAGRVCAVGSGGRVLLSDDDGANWRSIRRRELRHPSDVEFVDDRTGFIVGMDGLARTQDGGDTWQQVADQDTGSRIDARALAFVTRDHGWLAGAFGVLRRTDDGGRTWTRVETPALNDRTHLWALFFVDPRHGWAVGEEGLVIHTADGGTTWSRQPADGRSLLTDVRFLDPRRGWMVGFDRDAGTSTIFATTDGGERWTVEATVHGEELRALAVVDPDHAWAVGDSTHEQPQRILRRVAGNQRD